LARIIEQTFEQRGCLEVEKLSNIILSELISITPALRGTYPDLPPNPPLEPLAEQQRLFDSVARFAAVLAEDRPVCWLVEDVHWADGGTLALLRHLARRVKHLNFLIVLTYREVELSEGRFLNEVLNDLNRERLVERIKLTRFSREETHQLLKAMFAEEISQEFLEGIYRETEGNPFFVEEVCKALIEEGLVYRENGHWQQRRMNEIQVPQSVRVAIEARLDKLPATAQEALRLAAIIGREFSYEVLQKACDQPEDVLLEALETAERAQLVNEVKGRPRWVTYSFAHALIPSALRDGMSTLRLQRLHRKVAAAVEALDPDDYEVLAYHFAEGGQEEPAHKYYRLAGDRAFRAGAFQDAEQYYRLALDLATQPEEQAELNGRLSLTLANAGMFKPAIQAARQAIQLAQGLQDDDALGRLYSWLSYTTWQIGDVPGGLAACREGLEVMADYPDSAAKAALLHEAARQCYFNNLPEESGRLALQALAMAEHFGRKDIQVHTLATLALTQPTAQQIATMRQAVDLYHTVAPSEANFNLIVGISRTLNNLSEALRDTGRYAEGLDVLRQMLEAARSTGFAEAWAYNAIATILLEQADYAGAERQLAQARALFQADEGQLAVAIQENEALLLFYRGERQAGIGQLEAILDIARQGRDHQAMMISSNDLIKCLIYQEDWERIVSISQEMIAANAIQAVSDAKRASFFYNRAHALAELGDGAGARQAIATADERLAGESHPRLEAGRERAGAHLARAEGRWEDCFSAFERLIQLNAEMGRRWHQAQNMRALAAALRRRGEAADLPRAVEMEVQAQRIFVDIGVKL
jgi:tetratricopeptide (TPR) repeat protein